MINSRYITSENNSMLDANTFVIILYATFFFQAALLLVMSIYVRGYQSIQMWALGSLALGLGFACIHLRTFGFFAHELIVLTNVFIIIGGILYYYATIKQLQLPSKRKAVFSGSAFFIILIAIFTYVWENIDVRMVLFSFGFSILLSYMGYLLIRHAKPNIKRPAYFMALLFSLVTIFLIVRGFSVIFDGQLSGHIFVGEFLQSISIIFGLGISQLWTIGIIVLKNCILQESLAEKSRELEASAEDKGKLISILSHDLRGPVTTLASFTDILASDNFNPESAKYKEMVGAMQRTAYSTSILLDNLLDWGQMKSSFEQVEKTEMVYSEIIPDVMNLLTTTAESKKIQIIDAIPPSTKIVGDRRMIQGIFRNLISNAIKFTPKDGMIRLSLISSEVETPVFAIKDNGIGMNDATLDKIFERNEKTHRSGTNGESGIGLGLSLCREFVMKHDGCIWATSEPEKGSTFYFTIGN